MSASSTTSSLGGLPPAVFAEGAGVRSLSLEELLVLDVLFVNVLGTHTHLAGEWMIGLSSMFMHMEDNRSGSERLSLGDVLREFPVTPTKMDMSMHMLEVMYAPSDRLTLMAMIPHKAVSMDHLTRSGKRFTTRASGLGDASVTVLYTLLGDVYSARHRLVLRSGVSLPTGSNDERDRTPAGPDQKLPYPMQLGSGTFDLLPGLAYLGESEKWAWMTEARGILRLGRNDNDYRLGHRLNVRAWRARKLSDSVSLSAELAGEIWSNVSGSDPELNRRIVPTADPALRGGERLDLLVALNFYVPEGRLEGNRGSLEAGVPLYQSLDGPQLELDWQLRLVWNWTF